MRLSDRALGSRSGSAARTVADIALNKECACPWLGPCGNPHSPTDELLGVAGAIRSSVGAPRVAGPPSMPWAAHGIPHSGRPHAPSERFPINSSRFALRQAGLATLRRSRATPPDRGNSRDRQTAQAPLLERSKASKSSSKDLTFGSSLTADNTSGARNSGFPGDHSSRLSACS